MEQKTLLAQLKAFQTYLKNYIEAAKSRPQNEVNEESKQFTEEKDADKSELNYIDSRYSRLREHIETKYLDIFKGLPYDMNTNIIGVEHIHREIGFVLDTIANLEAFDANQSNNQPSFKSNNQPFTKDEIQIINNQLDDLQNKLLETIHKEEITPERAIPFIESVKSEISDLKAEVANPNLGRKDWKNHLINTMLTLTFTLSFSQEARNTIFIYFQGLFIYLQQNIFLLKP
jgi:hypothetical protein